jgi:hypothetical protein
MGIISKQWQIPLICLILFGDLSFESKLKFLQHICHKLLERNILGSNYMWIWKGKVPLKIKICVTPCAECCFARGNMQKKKWLGNPSCSFCDQMGTCNHLLFSCLGSYG